MTTVVDTAWGMSGRKVTPFVVLVLLLLCLGIAYFVTVVHRLQEARDRTAEHWRQLATLLDNDYRLVGQRWSDSTQVSPDGRQTTASSAGTETEIFERFRQSADRFRTTVDLANQRGYADSIEAILAECRNQLPFDVKASEAIQQNVQQYNTSLGSERRILKSMGGRLVRVFLVIPELADFQLGR